MKKYILGALLLFVVLVVPLAQTRAQTNCTVTVTYSTHLTNCQVQAILDLLVAFGADTNTVANVKTTLAGGTSIGQSTTQTTTHSTTSTNALPVITINGDNTKSWLEYKVPSGGKVSFSWNVTNPDGKTTCAAAGHGIGDNGSGSIVLSSGFSSWSTPPLYANITYGMACTNSAGTVYKYANVSVGTPSTTATMSNPAPTITINNDDSTQQMTYSQVAFGGTATFTWNVSQPTGTVTNCFAAGTGLGDAATGYSTTPLSGTWVTPPIYANITYGIACNNTNAAGVTSNTTYKYVTVPVAEMSVTPQAAVACGNEVIISSSACTITGAGSCVQKKYVTISAAAGSPITVSPKPLAIHAGRTFQVYTSDQTQTLLSTTLPSGASGGVTAYPFTFTYPGKGSIILSMDFNPTNPYDLHVGTNCSTATTQTTTNTTPLVAITSSLTQTAGTAFTLSGTGSPMGSALCFVKTGDSSALGCSTVQSNGMWSLSFGSSVFPAGFYSFGIYPNGWGTGLPLAGGTLTINAPTQTTTTTGTATTQTTTTGTATTPTTTPTPAPTAVEMRDLTWKTNTGAGSFTHLSRNSAKSSCDGMIDQLIKPLGWWAVCWWGTDEIRRDGDVPAGVSVSTSAPTTPTTQTTTTGTATTPTTTAAAGAPIVESLTTIPTPVLTKQSTTYVIRGKNFNFDPPGNVVVNVTDPNGVTGSISSFDDPISSTFLSFKATITVPGIYTYNVQNNPPNGPKSPNSAVGVTVVCGTLDGKTGLSTNTASPNYFGKYTFCQNNGPGVVPFGVNVMGPIPNVGNGTGTYTWACATGWPLCTASVSTTL